MATQDTTEDKTEEVEEVVDQVETEQSEDEQLDTETTDEETTETENENEEETEEEDVEDETETEEEAKFEKRFSQIQGDTPEEYAKNLEEAYRQSSTEGQRLAIENKEAQKWRDQVAAAVAKNPEIAKLLEESTGEGAPAPYVDPALQYAREQMNNTFAKEYNEFSELHPELVSDDVLREKVLAELSIFADAYDAKGKRLGMADGLKKAWISLGLDAEDKKEKVMTTAKTQAAQPKTQSKPKAKIVKPQFTDEQLQFAQKMGLSEKELAEYSK
jgi:hypothetical protein